MFDEVLQELLKKPPDANHASLPLSEEEQLAFDELDHRSSIDEPTDI
jgi:hypothetical protein